MTKSTMVHPDSANIPNIQTRSVKQHGASKPDHDIIMTPVAFTSQDRNDDLQRSSRPNNNNNLGALTG